LLVVIFGFASAAFAQTTIPALPKENILSSTLPQTALAVAGSALVLGIISLIIQPFFVLLAFLPLLFYRQKKRSWGVVYNSITKQPVPYIPVFIVEKKNNRLIIREKQISTKEGRFGFIVPRGEYFLKVISKQYVFPSKNIQESSDGRYQSLYFGTPIIIIDNDQVVACNIPVDPVVPTRTPFAVLADHLLDKVRVPALIVGSAFSLYLVVFFTSVVSIMVFAVYIIVWILEFLSYFQKTRAYQIIDAKSKDPIASATVKVINKEGKILKVSMTNLFGKFYPLLDAGNFYLEISHKDYKTQTREITVGRNGKIKGGKILLERSAQKSKPV
jgi:hypothetical protein